jgi:CDP-diacylglycerol--serine O-phosphatidyltransferase
MQYQSMKVTRHLPNAITLLNLLSGSIAALWVLQGEALKAGLMMGFALVFDFLDGLVARALGVKSEIGRELDSLADVVSFGLLPGLMMLMMMAGTDNIPGDPTPGLNVFAIPGLLFPLFAALRLAKFNLDTTQTVNFRGMPTPAGSIFVAGLYLTAFGGSTVHLATWIASLCENYWFLLAFTSAICTLMVARLPMLSLKYRKADGFANVLRAGLVIISLVLFEIWHFAAIPVIMTTYVLVSLIFKKQISNT